MPFFLSLACVNASMAQTKSATDLIRDLTYQSDRPDISGKRGQFDCGSARGGEEEDRALTNSLVKLGPSAVPDIEKGLDSLDRRGSQSPFMVNAAWLFYAYAKIEGPAGFPRLRRMMANPRLDLLRPGLETSASIALSLTSYVYGRGDPGTIVCRPYEPRDALEDVILAWNAGDQATFKAHLGPHAKVTLDSLIEGRTWEAVRAQFWHRRAGRDVAVGYRFRIAGRWSEPLETLVERHNEGETFFSDISSNPPSPQIDTEFTNRFGVGCGEHRVQLHLGKDQWDRASYFVDNTDLGDLLRLISSCAADRRDGETR